jgi:ferredoxin/flavodoxin---NADP+ reductase
VTSQVATPVTTPRERPRRSAERRTELMIEPRPFVVAVIGAGPSGIYAAEALSQQTDVPVRVAVIDRLPVPFGLVRYGVAPDHESIRSIRNTLERTLEKPSVRFFGDVTIGADLTVDELREAVDAVIYAYGAGSHKVLNVPGEQLPGVMAAPEFVAWYCGHPDVHPDVLDAGRERLDVELINQAHSAVVVGVGNVALDVARVLIKSAEVLTDTDMADEVLESLARKEITDVHLLGRRGPAYTSFTTKELRELGQLPDVDIMINPTDLTLDESSRAVVGRDKVAARNVALFQEWAARTVRSADNADSADSAGSAGSARQRLWFHFWTRPVSIDGDGAVDSIEVERTMIDASGAVVGTGERTIIPAQLVIRSVGYRGIELPGVPFDAATGRVPHAEGRVIRDGGFSADEYVTGWIKRGPTGVIGTNKSDAVETVTSLLADIRDGVVTPHHDSHELDRLLADRGIHPLDVDAWHRIDAAEIDLGHSHGRRRTTLAHRSDLLAAAEDPTGGGQSAV